jgi:hypothetical protein
MMKYSKLENIETLFSHTVYIKYILTIINDQLVLMLPNVVCRDVRFIVDSNKRVQKILYMR